MLECHHDFKYAFIGTKEDLKQIHIHFPLLNRENTKMTKQRRQHIAAIARHIRLFVTILQGLLRKNDFICATQHVLVLEEANSTQSSVLREGMNPLRGRNSGRKEGHGKRLLLDHAMLENGEETTI